MHRVDLILPRHAFGPRETARPGEIWRSLQDIAVLASSRAGYTPRDYREQQISWVMGEPDLHGFGLREEGGEVMLAHGFDLLLPASELSLPGRHNHRLLFWR